MKKEELLAEKDDKMFEFSCKYSFTMARRAHMDDEDYEKAKKLIAETSFINSINSECTEIEILEALNRLKIIVNELKPIFAKYE